MKKILLIILFVICSILSYSQAIPNDQNVQRLRFKATNALITDLYFIWRGDTIDFTNLVQAASMTQNYFTANNTLKSGDLFVLNKDTFQLNNIGDEYDILQKINGRWINRKTIDTTIVRNLAAEVVRDSFVFLTPSDTSFLATKWWVLSLSPDSTVIRNLAAGVVRDSFDIVEVGDTVGASGYVSNFALEDTLQYYSKSANAFYGTLPVTDINISIPYPYEMANANYRRQIRAWYWASDGVKTWQQENGIYDPVYTTTGFTCKVNSAQGFIEYYVQDTVQLTAIQSELIETDPIFAADSANLLHWSDTIQTTGAGIASRYDVSLKQDASTAVTKTLANTVDNSITVTDGATGRLIKQSLPTIDTNGSLNIPSGQTYKIGGNSILNANLVSGSAGEAGTIFTGNGTTSSPTWLTPLSAIGASLTQNYFPIVGATKLVNSLNSTDGTSTTFVGGSAAGSKIIYKSTTGTGTTTGIAHQWVGGTNGGTVAMTVLNNGDVGIGTTDLDNTPPVGRLTVKGSTNNGTSNIIVGRDSDEANVFSVDTDGDIITSGTITASSATTNTEVINLGQLKDKVKSGSISMVAGTWPIYFEKPFPTAEYVTSVWGVDSNGNEIGININTQYDYGFEIDVPEDCIVKYDCTYPETVSTPENNQWYGIEYNVTNPSSTLTRIGNLSLHAKLPVQNKMKGCLLTDAITVNYYLSPTDWTKKSDGITASVLDGTDGQVMIEKPVIYWKFETEGNINRVKISEYPLTGFSQKPKCYIGAYEAALQRSNSKLSSVVNTTTDFRGGNNTSAWDAASNSLLGKPATNYHIVNARTYARNRGTGWNQLIYDNYMELFWLFAIEYATFNSQLAVNNTLTSSGYKQGGLGNGVTTANSTEWNNFNGYNPFINCGASNSLASGSGEVSVNVTNFGGTGVTRTFTVNRYRGVENPFGHIWKFVDGLNVYNSSGVTTMYVIDNPSNLASDTQTNSRTGGVIAQVEGYGKTMLFGNSGDIVPSVATGASSTTYMCDYFYTNSTANSWTILLFGGNAIAGGVAGFLYSNVFYSSSVTSANVGSRLSAR